MGAVITHHKVGIAGHNPLSFRGHRYSVSRQIWFFKLAFVNHDVPIINGNSITGEPYDTFDIIVAWIAGEIEDNDIATLRSSEFVGEPAHNEELPGMEIRLHTLPIYYITSSS